nr:F373 [uncultured bacterium]
MGSQQYLHKVLTASGGSLSQLLTVSRQRADLLGQVRQCLPSELAAAVHSAALDRGCLRLGVSGGAWAARLRFMAPQLCRQLADLPSGPVERVEVHVAAAAGGNLPLAVVPPVPLSDASRAHIESVANASEDPRLAAALRALSRSGE